MAAISPVYVIMVDWDGSVDPDNPGGISRETYEFLKENPSHFSFRSLENILAAWRYLLHLPAAPFDMMRLPFDFLGMMYRYEPGHIITVLPKGLGEKLDGWYGRLRKFGTPCLIVCDDDSYGLAKNISNDASFTLSPIKISDISTETLRGNIEQLRAFWSDYFPDDTNFMNPDEWKLAYVSEFTSLPSINLMRDCGGRINGFDSVSGRSDRFLRDSRIHQSVSRLNSIEGEIAEWDKITLRPANSGQAWSINEYYSPLVVGAFGVAPKFRRSFSRTLEEYVQAGIISVSQLNDSDLNPSETGDMSRSALETIIVGGALPSRANVVIWNETIPDEAFTALNNLESYWSNYGRKFDPLKEARLRKKVDDGMGKFWTPENITAIRESSQIEAYSNFPLGILTLPGTKSPISTYKSIYYRDTSSPAELLVAAMGPRPACHITKKSRVLLVEGVPETDPVGKISREHWSFLKKKLDASFGSDFFAWVEVESTEAVEAEIGLHNPDILIVSAHGSYNVKGDVAGVVIGGQFVVGDEIGRVPPVVILSACHTSPRGAGSANIGDTLLKAGAVMVLSTLVPVHVKKNSVLVSQMLLMIRDAIMGYLPDRNFADLWRTLQPYNIMTDMTVGNKSLMDWSTRPQVDRPNSSPLEVFVDGIQSKRWVLRPGFLHEDAEKVLVDIAKATGDAEKVANWLRNPGYAPESMMYVLLGDPRRVFINSEYIE